MFFFFLTHSNNIFSHFVNVIYLCLCFSPDSVFLTVSQTRFRSVQFWPIVFLFCQKLLAPKILLQKKIDSKEIDSKKVDSKKIDFKKII
jgi:hypothetical protein